MPQVSIIIPVFNGERFLAQALESALNQTYRDFEIIVVDDGSTDNSKIIVQEFIQKYGDKIRYCYQENQGHAISRNKGIKNARGSYIAFLDADDIWQHDKLKKQISFLESHKDFGLIHCARVRIDANDCELPTFPINPKILSGCIFYPLLLRRAQICTSTVVCRKSCLEHVGTFDENFPDRIGGEDRELWLRIAKNYKVAYIEEPLVKYRCLEQSLSHSRKKELLIKGRYHVIDKSLKDEKNIIKKMFLKRKAYSSVHRELIYSADANNDVAEAQRECLKAIMRFPFTVRLYFKLVALTFKKMGLKNV